MGWLDGQVALVTGRRYFVGFEYHVGGGQRAFAGGALSGCLRITVGTPRENTELLTALRELASDGSGRK